MATFGLLLEPSWGGRREDSKRRLEYEFQLDLKRIIAAYSKDYWEYGTLDADGRFLPQGRKRQYGFNSALPDFEEVINTPRKPNEPVYEFRSARLIKGNLQQDAVLVPELASTVIDLDSYLKEYDPKNSPRIYNLPGRIVKKGEPEKDKKNTPK
ncbi:MAG: hypothetical protein L0Y70_16190 [Gemmataceae bacterium]|nr:hypothetical protein [Gemmataceae bacterium]